MWKALQLAVIGAVVASNIHWEWTPNKYIPALFGALIAWGGTWLVFNRHDLKGAFFKDVPMKKRAATGAPPRDGREAAVEPKRPPSGRAS
jgi:hypothetical protein